nr:transposase [Corallococcus exiguus]
MGEGDILALDEMGFLKKGEKSVEVARQYTGTAVKVEKRRQAASSTPGEPAPKALGLPMRRNPMRAFLARRGLH